MKQVHGGLSMWMTILGILTSFPLSHAQERVDAPKRVLYDEHMSFTPIRSARIRTSDNQALIAQFHWDFTVPVGRREYDRIYEHADVAPQRILKAFTSSKAEWMELSMTDGYWDSQAWGSYPRGRYNHTFEWPPMQGTTFRTRWEPVTLNRTQIKPRISAASKILSKALSGSFSTSMVDDWATWIHHCNSTTADSNCVPRNNIFHRAGLTGTLATVLDLDELPCSSNLHALVSQLPCKHVTGIGAILDASVLTGGDYWSLRIRGDYDHEEDTIKLGIQVDSVLPSRKYRSGSKQSSAERLGRESVCCEDDSPTVCAESRFRLPVGEDVLPPVVNPSITNCTAKVGETFQVSVARLLNIDNDFRTPEDTTTQCDVLSKHCPLAGRTIVYLHDEEIEQRCSMGAVSDLLIPRELFVAPRTQGFSFVHRLRSTSLDEGSFHTKIILSDSSVASSAQVQLVLRLPWQLYLSLSTSSIYGCPADTEQECQRIPLSESRVQMHPAAFRAAPGQVSFQFALPINVSVVDLYIPFRIAHGLYNDHSPDAQRGIEVPPAAIALWTATGVEEVAYSQAVHVEPPSPDFSFTFTGITFGCCALTLLVGSYINILGKRPSIMKS
eukprot:gb/GECG01012935.1/.p1 GENE.gb/GECG01012935.1/~~gb/GECG01012935.1/.p1  ORF type:complete len:612 (+),score=48.23 gb/GECG01012935.1/:1-1836(+)